jgi:hypothetical protein
LCRVGIRVGTHKLKSKYIIGSKTLCKIDCALDAIIQIIKRRAGNFSCLILVGVICYSIRPSKAVENAKSEHVSKGTEFLPVPAKKRLKPNG